MDYRQISKKKLDTMYYLCNGKRRIIYRTNMINYYITTQKGKNQLCLNFFRQISLLNNDYKVIAKILATRLQAVFPNIINDDQSGYPKGRYIGQNVRILEDVTFLLKKTILKVFCFQLILILSIGIFFSKL